MREVRSRVAEILWTARETNKLATRIQLALAVLILLNVVLVILESVEVLAAS